MTETRSKNEVVASSKASGEKRLKVRKILLKLSLALTIIGPLIFLVAALGAKLGLWSWMFGLGTLSAKIGPLVLMIGAVVSLLALLSAILIKPRKGIVIAVIGLLVPGFVIGKLAGVKATAANLPYIHDVSTDTQDPPVFGEVVMAERQALAGVNPATYVGKKAPVTNADGSKSQALVSALQTKAYPEVRPLVLDSKGEVAFGEALATAKSMGWKIKSQDVATGRIDATDTTFWYGFQDDVTIRLREDKGGGTIVDVRSLSRVGESDLGKNAQRVEAFLEALAK